MKTKNLIIVLLIFLVASVTAQLPQNIKNAFKSKYPDATMKKFKHKQGNYVINFKNGGEKHKAIFNENGTWAQTITRKRQKEIPAIVKKTLNGKYSEWHKSKYYLIETSTDTLYSVDVYTDLTNDDGPPNNTEYIVYFKPSGDFVKQVRRY